MRTRTDDRAVSEVLGFVFVFSLVVSSVALVSLVGFEVLEDTRDNEEVNNAVRAFDVLRDNLADIHRQGAPSRATEISLQDAQLRVGDPVLFNVTGVDTDTGIVSKTGFLSQPIIFDSQSDQDVVYSGGAVFLETRDGGVMLQEPPAIFQSDRFVYPIIQTRAVGDVVSLGGSTVRIRAENSLRQPLRNDFTDSASDFDYLVVNITSQRSDLWRDYLEEQPDTSCVVPKENNVRCTVGKGVSGPGTVYVSRTVIQYKLEG